MLSFHSKTTRCILLLTISLVSVAIFSNTFGYPYFIQICYLLLGGFAYFTYKTVYYKILTRTQIFYIVPLLVLNFFAKDQVLSDHLFKLIVFSLSTLICFYEILARSEHFKHSSGAVISACLGVLLIVCSHGVCSTFPQVATFIWPLNMLALYFLTTKDSNNAFILPKIKLRKSISAPLYLIIMITTYAGLILSTRFHFLLYICYIVSAVNLCFCFRRNKALFIIAGITLTILAIASVKIPEKHMDVLLLTILVSLLHVRAPIIYWKQTQHGLIRVEYNYKRNSLDLVNDGVYHGEKRYDKGDHVHTLYYGDLEKGPIAAVLTLLPSGDDHKIGVLGLGAGTIARFGKKGQQMTFYEINPEVVKIAKHKGFFDYLAKSKAKVKIILGDAREELVKAKDNYYDLLCVDVYTADKMPKHFLTIEAIQLYSKKLKKNGILMLNIASKADRNLESMIATIASRLNLIAYSYHQSLSMNDKSSFESHVPYRAFLFIEKLCNVRLTSFFKQPYKEAYSWAILSKSELRTPSACEVDAAHAPRWNKLHAQEESVYTDEEVIPF